MSSQHPLQTWALINDLQRVLWLIQPASERRYRELRLTGCVGQLRTDGDRAAKNSLI